MIEGSNTHWKDYSTYLNKSIDEFDVNDAEVILFGITTVIGDIFSNITQHMKGNNDREDFIELIGHLYYNIACR